MTFFNNDGYFFKDGRSPDLKLVAVGDVIPSGRIEKEFVSGNVESIFGNTASIFQTVDFVLYNLETPICKKEDPIAKCGSNFKADSGIVNGLKKMNFSVAALANNHIMDQGKSGLLQTLEALDSAGINHHGANLSSIEAAASLQIERNGIKISFLNFAEGEFSKAGPAQAGAARLDPIENKLAIEIEKKKNDLVIVSVHAGKEFQHFPSPRIQTLYRSFVDYGADLVIGHHPHIPQGVEHYQDSLIAYSFGDFLFEHGMDPGTCATMAFEIGLTRAGVTAVRLHPIKKKADATFTLMRGREKQYFIDHINRISQPLKDAEELNLLYEQGILKHFDLFYVHNLMRHTAQMNGREEKRKEAAEFLYNMVDCPAHREALKTGLKMIYDVRYKKDEKIQCFLDSLYKCLETLGSQESIEPWKPRRSIFQKVKGKLIKIWS